MRRHVWPRGLAAVCLGPLLMFWPVLVQAMEGVQGAPAGEPAASLPPLTLDQALSLAEAHSPAVAAAERGVQAQEGALQQAGLLRNPAFNAAVEDLRRHGRTTTATLDVPIELGGKRAARIGAAERARALAVAELTSARAQRRADVMRAFFAVLVAQERAALSADSALLAGRAADTVARRVAAGKVSPVDERRARVDEANAQLEAVEAAAELQGARQALAALWGDTDLPFGQVRGDVEGVPVRRPWTDLVADLDASPGLLARRLETERRQGLLQVERSKAVPDVTLSVGAKRDHELGRAQALVGVSVPLPLFDRNQGAVYEATMRTYQAGDEYQVARLQALAALQQASTQLGVAAASARTLQGTVLPAAQQAYEAAGAGFQAGKFGFLDVIDAQRALLQARARYLAALSSAQQAAVAIDRVLGR